MSERYNVVVVGAGSAGLVSAYIAATVKAKVALVERNKMGGDCLNYGCVPSKSLIQSAKFIHSIKQHKKYGVKSADCSYDFSAVMERVHEKIAAIEPHDSIERYSKLGVECITGDAKILNATTVQVGGRLLKTKNVILALGASPLIPAIKGLESTPYLTSENLWDLKELPKDMVVLGGGPIGCEMAQAFARLGSKVTQVEMGPRLLPREDEKTSALIEKTFAEESIRVCTRTKALEITAASHKTLLCERDGQILKIPFDHILLAVGRKPNTEQLDCDSLGIKLNKNGTIQVDEFLRANGKNIFACGDVAGPYQFTHTASHQAWFCAVNALFRPFKKFKVNYDVIPWVTFTDPEIAHVGLTQIEAKSKNIEFEHTEYGIDDLDRAITDSNDQGFVSVLTKKGSDKILGATIVGFQAGELITEFVSAMKHGYGLNAILGTIHSYPTYSEANKFAAGNWKKAHAPQFALDILEKIHGLRR